jgi:hypothetical protein
MLYPRLRLLCTLTVLLVWVGTVGAQQHDARVVCPAQLVGLKSTIWPSLDIPVCWEALSPDQAQERTWVRSAVQATWEQHSALRFVGWEACAPSSRGIRIGVADINPHTKGLGNQLDGQPNGMVLNFTFEAWSPTCRSRREDCIRTLAAHEFGHALGFTHEQNRSDAPTWCQGERQGIDGDIPITPYDLHSVMNYCNPKWLGDGRLSAEDIAGVQRWYGRPQAASTRYNGAWQTSLIYSNPACAMDAVSLTVSGTSVQGRLQTPAGQVVEATGSIDQDSRLAGMQFRLNPQDLITLRGRLTGGAVESTDCGCGQFAFTRQEAAPQSRGERGGAR